MKKRRKRRYKNHKFTKSIIGGFRKIGTLNIVLLCVFGYMIYINWKMIGVFLTFGSAPETAWCALIAALLGECGICGWIKTSKEKHASRNEYQLDPNDAEEYTEEIEEEHGMEE